MTLEIGRAPLSRTEAAVRTTREPGSAPLSRTDVAVKSAQEIRAERRAAALRAEVALKVTLVTLTWLVTVSLLLGWGITGPQRQPGTILLAALAAVVGPFVGAVIATRHGQFRLGGVYVVLTLVMVLPALLVVRAG